MPSFFLTLSYVVVAIRATFKHWSVVILFIKILFLYKEFYCKEFIYGFVQRIYWSRFRSLRVTHIRMKIGFQVFTSCLEEFYVNCGYPYLHLYLHCKTWIYNSIALRNYSCKLYTMKEVWEIWSWMWRRKNQQATTMMTIA